MRVIGYARRSTEEQPTTLEGQAVALQAWAAAAGFDLEHDLEHDLEQGFEVVAETVSGGVEPEDRPVLSRVLDRLAAGEAGVLVVTTTDRLARTHAVHRLDYYAAREGWRLLILDELGRHDDPEARLLHGIRVSVAEYERALIGRRTKAGLERRRAAGVRLGRPRRCPDDVLARVVALRAGGARLVDIAAAMNAAGVPTPGGSARWWPSHVSRLLKTQDALQDTCPAGRGPGRGPGRDLRPTTLAASTS